MRLSIPFGLEQVKVKEMATLHSSGTWDLVAKHLLGVYSEDWPRWLSGSS